jgi:Protein of unknown function (DUF3551)
MRVLILAVLLALAIATVAAIGSAQAQTYDPDYPICLHVYGRVSYYDCLYTSLAQCAASASGRSAQCVVNPYFAAARPRRRHRHD